MKRPLARLASQIGLILFLAGFGFFLLAPLLVRYELSPEALTALPPRGVSNGVLLEELAAAQGTTAGNPLAFSAQADRFIAAANSRGANISEWDLASLKMALAKSAGRGFPAENVKLYLLLSIGLACAGGLLHFLPRIWLSPPGIRNDGVFSSSIKSRGIPGILIGVFLIGFYLLLYFYPFLITSWIGLADPISQALRGKESDQWFFYGLLYTLCVLVMGVRMAINYRHSRYQLVRSASVAFFQLGFAFLIPAILVSLNKPSYDFKSAWPLEYGFFTDYNLKYLLSQGNLGWAILIWGIALSFLLVPLFSYFFGKRWYCSWVCGCGGLAETLGDPWRHLSSKKLSAWRLERWLVHLVLVAAVLMTAAVLLDFFTGMKGQAYFGGNSWKVRHWYGFLIGSIFAGVVGTGFYPLMGNRVWCRFGCPLAAILGMVQRFKSRFRITTNGGQCISCGNCSTYCEMGIDVRAYAQRGQNIVRSSCVGCGICAQVCPRGVLRLENGPSSGRYDEVSMLEIGQGRIEVS
jgi:ferredoxin-type protein NapH